MKCPRCQHENPYFRCATNPHSPIGHRPITTSRPALGSTHADRVERRPRRNTDHTPSRSLTVLADGARRGGNRHTPRRGRARDASRTCERGAFGLELGSTQRRSICDRTCSGVAPPRAAGGSAATRRSAAHARSRAREQRLRSARTQRRQRPCRGSDTRTPNRASTSRIACGDPVSRPRSVTPGRT